MSINSKTARMGSEPIFKLLLKMSLPTMFSMLIQALYNIVDSIFVSQYSSVAFDAVTLVFPMQMLVLSFSLGIGVGTNSIVSRRLGEGNRDSASMCAQTGLFLSLVMSVFFAITGYGLAYAYVKPFTQDNPEVFPLAMQYLTIVMCVCFGQMIQILCEKCLQATGHMNIPMISQLIGAITNIVLDPLFIFTFKLGVAGAAIATVIGQIVAMTFIVIYIAKKNPGIQIFFKNFRFRKENFREIIKVAVPTTVMNAVSSFTTIVLNAILKSLHSLTAVTVLGSYFKLQSFVFMPVFGLTQGALPIMGYNYGSRNKQRFMQTFKLSIIISFSIMVVGVIIFQLLPAQLMGIFNAEGELLSLGTIALKTISISFIGAAFSIVITTMFQSLGNGVYSLIMSLLRQVILLIPAAYIFGKIWGINGAWWSYPFAETLTFLIFLPIALITMKRAFSKSLFKDIPAESDILSEENMTDVAPSLNTVEVMSNTESDSTAKSDIEDTSDLN